MIDAIRRLDARLHGGAAHDVPPWFHRIAPVAAVVCGAFLFTVAFRMKGPTIHPDEFGFLTNGQVLLGHNEAPLPTGSFYPAGFGVVTALGAAITGSIAGAYRFTLLVNFALALVTAFVASRLATRGFGASGRIGLLVGTLVFVAPGTIVSAMFSWAEIAARLAFVCFVMMIMKATASPSSRLLASAGLFTGLMPALHGRFVLLLPITCLIFAWWAWKKHARVVAAGVGIAATFAGFVGSYLLNRFVKSTVYLQSYDQENRLLKRLVNPGLYGAMLRKIAGQTWYLLATSYGLVGVGVVCVGAMLWRARRRTGVMTDPRLVGFMVILCGTAAVIFTGGLQLLYGARGDHHIYGRYVEMTMPALLVLGGVAVEQAVGLARRAWLATAAFILLIPGAYVLYDRGDVLKFRYVEGKVVFPNIIGVDFVRYFVRPGLVTFGLFFAVACIAMWLLFRWRSTAAVTILVCVFAVGSVYSGQRTLLNRGDDLAASGDTVAIVEASGTEQVGLDMGIQNDRTYWYLRYKLHPIRVVRFDVSSPDAVIPETFNCLYGWGDRPPSQGEWVVVAEEKVLQRLLWQRVGSKGC